MSDGCAAAVTRTGTGDSQWAETTTIARGFGCASNPPPQEYGWQKQQLSADEQKEDPAPIAARLIEQREGAGNLDHAIALLNWHVERQPESTALHLLLAEAHSRAAEMLDLA